MGYSSQRVVESLDLTVFTTRALADSQRSLSIEFFIAWLAPLG